MRINHNIAALNASNRLKANDNAISKNLQKLSSGYRINSAADDAAGLAVSEKMRAQINGLNQAEDNAQNGISLVQTAEGGLNETESILQRMNTLAVESSNGTYQDETDRDNLNKEIEALKSEVDRISTSTNFNGISLLDGSLGGSTSGSAVAATIDVGAATIDTSNVATASTFGVTAATAGDVSADGTLSYSVTYKTAQGTTKTVDIDLTVDADAGVYDADGNLLVSSGTVSAADVGAALTEVLTNNKDFRNAFAITDNADGTLTFNAKTAGTAGESIVAVTKNDDGIEVDKTAGTDAFDAVDMSQLAVYDGTNASTSIFTVNGQKFAFVASDADASDLGSDVTKVFLTGSTLDDGDVTQMSQQINAKTGLATDTSTTTINFKASVSAGKAGKALVFQIGSDNKDDQRVSLSVADMSSKGLGIEGISVATQPDAQAAVDTIKAAINKVSATRADLGALQNRLEHTTNNLSTMSENLTSAESTIRDVDMSSEMVDLTKNQILEQAATSMLAQANAQPQSVLTLLRG